MATYTYTNSSALISPSTIRTTVPVLPPDPFTLPSMFYGNSITNTRNLATYLTYNTGTAFPNFSAPFPQTFDWVCPIGEDNYPNFADAVYDIFCQQQDDASNLFENDTVDRYFLVTTAIDAGIAALPITTGAEIARKAYLVNRRQAMQVTFNAGNYILTNSLIDYIEAALIVLNSGVEDNPPSTIVLTTPSSITANIPIYTSLAPTYITQGGWYNVLTNTLTTVEYPYTWNFLLPVNSTNIITNPTVYPDGVYQNYSSQILIGTFPPIVAFVVAPVSYLLVTTTIDTQIQLFEDNYDPNNTAEAITFAELQSIQAQIAAAYAANDYILTNSLIEQVPALLENGLSRSISAGLTSDADMSVFFTVPPAMPVGTYTEGAGTITNTLTGVAFTFDGFPLDSTDLTQSLNSEDLGFGVDFPDGVYQIVVTWLVDGLLFTAECYLVVTTDWQCCIDKAVGKKCGKLNTALMQANLTNAVRIVALYSDVNTANALISEGNRECSSCGCGCS
jgi:hypothetical protein